MTERGTWQPIKTAPEDIAVLTYGFGYEVAHFNSLLGLWVANWDHRPIKPTHWMQLPMAPHDNGEQQDKKP